MGQLGLHKHFQLKQSERDKLAYKMRIAAIFLGINSDELELNRFVSFMMMDSKLAKKIKDRGMI